LDAVLLTHEHRDHTAGLDELRSFNFALNRAMPIYARNSVHQTLRKEFSYAFAPDPYPGVPCFELIEISDKPFHIGQLEISTINAMHLRLAVFGFRIGNFAYLTDLSHIEANEKNKLLNLDVLVISALHRETHYSHFNLGQALQLISEVRPSRAYLTHISHFMGMHAEVNASLPQNVELAYDGLKIDIPGAL
jgi:phosphoribosyl 1,2-cyclic phosphate phosphodiesterase